MTFEEFWRRCLEDEMFYNIDRSAARIAWEAATLAERERCAKIVAWAQGRLSGDLAVDVIDGVADAILNPDE